MKARVCVAKLRRWIRSSSAPSGAVIGRVTSGGFAPSLARAIALGFVPPAHANPGTKLQVSVRGRLQPAEVTSTPFVPHRYFRKAKAS